MKKPKNYYCHKSQTISNQITLSNNLQIVQKIGQGAFGQVFKVFDHNSSQLKVIKRHKRQSSQAIISKENQVMREMSGSDGFARVKQIQHRISNTSSNTSSSSKNMNILFFQNQQQRLNHFNKNKNISPLPLSDNQPQPDQIIMMQCLGQNLNKVVNKKIVSIYSMKKIAYQLITRLKQLHQKTYVHRDLKPQNILLGNQLNPHKIYLVDFGLVSTYRKDIKKIRKIYDGVIGTAIFCPLASHYGNQQFPKDDLQSLGYVLIYLVRGQLPWRFKDEKLSEEEKFQKMKQMKESLSINQLCQGVSCLKKYFNIVRKLKHSDIVDYRQLLEIFIHQLTLSKQCECFEFCKDNCIYKLKRQDFSHQLDQNNSQKTDQKDRQNNITKYCIQSKFLKK